MPRLHLTPRDERSASGAAPHLRAVALRLFAERGVDGVTVREIAAAAGQKNHGAVGYHFGSKESLVREIVLDGAIAMDERRNARLDALEAAGGPRTIREIVDVLVFPAVERDDDYYIRFITMLTMSHRELMMDALENRWNRGYQRCLDHLRRLMPPMPPALVRQRLVFMGAYLGAVLARREQALADHSRAHPTWGAAASLDHFAHTLTALLAEPYAGGTDMAATADDDVRPTNHGPVG